MTEQLFQALDIILNQKKDNDDDFEALINRHVSARYRPPQGTNSVNSFEKDVYEYLEQRKANK